MARALGRKRACAADSESEGGVGKSGGGRDGGRAGGEEAGGRRGGGRRRCLHTSAFDQPPPICDLFTRHQLLGSYIPHTHTVHHHQAYDGLRRSQAYDGLLNMGADPNPNPNPNPNPYPYPNPNPNPRWRWHLRKASTRDRRQPRLTLTLTLTQTLTLTLTLIGTLTTRAPSRCYVLTRRRGA